jgi:hypothetical protein
LTSEFKKAFQKYYDTVKLEFEKMEKMGLFKRKTTKILKKDEIPQNIKN